MKRGIIVDIKARHWIVLTPEGQFRRIPTTRVAGLGEEVAVPDRAPRSARRIVALAAAIAVALLLIALPGLFRTHSEVAYYFAIDFNPSLELAVDKHERVVELRSWNKDGAEIIRGMTYENIPMQEVLGQIIERAQAGPYLTGDSQAAIVTRIAADLKPDDRLGARIAGEVRQLLESTLNLTVTLLSAPVQLRDEAAEQGVTPGQMAIHLLSRYNGDPIPMQELREQTTRQAAAAHGGLQSIMSRWDEDEGEELLRRLLLQELDAEQHEADTKPAEQFVVPPAGQDDASRSESGERKSSVPHSPSDAARAGLTHPEPGKSGSHGSKAEHPGESPHGQANRPQQESPSTPGGEKSPASAGPGKRPPEKEQPSGGKGRGAEQGIGPQSGPERSGRAVQAGPDRKPPRDERVQSGSDSQRGDQSSRPGSDRSQREGNEERGNSERSRHSEQRQQPARSAKLAQEKAA